MVHQADVTTNGKAATTQPNVAASVSGLAHDAIELAELQVNLLKLDVTAAVRKGGTGIALLVAAACLMLGCVPVALMALAQVFMAQWAWSPATAFAAAAAVGLAVSGIAGAAAWRSMRSALAAIERSRDEFNRNIHWLKSNLKRDSTSNSPDRR